MTAVIVVSGVAGRMGRACAMALRDTGAVLLVGIDPSTLHEVVSELSGLGATVEVVRCDATDARQVEALAKTVEATGDFAALAHTAGISPTMASGRRVLEIDFVGTARLLDALFPLVGPGSVAVCASRRSRDTWRCTDRRRWTSTSQIPCTRRSSTGSPSYWAARSIPRWGTSWPSGG
jgi:NAD(P)-dependent dehydrogenase (short-subunit alcohol dehydrogenase family)